ncbi:MAG: 50S ribosomal protein L1 [Candidatus Peregrinibacteria bacterium GW2011_GWA2_47_7]|nr:MAG: 50S ribosomal protein L1 [Candidatus Peregrinibacteria bacterium GW2011_GWA2_47_7]
MAKKKSAVPKAAEKKRGKKYQVARALVERKLYPLAEAVALLVRTSVTKFDSSCELHMNLGVDPKHADQVVRGTVVLPHGTGKAVRVIAFVSEAQEKTAKAAGAFEVGIDNLIEKITKGWLDFDVAVAEPAVMKNIGKIAKILGQKGLMPNPKAGTVTPDVASAIAEIKKGKVEFRVDKLANLHNIFGKVSFGPEKLEENLKTVVQAVLQAKPTGVKGNYVNSLTLATTMGPGVSVDVSALK